MLRSPWLDTAEKENCKNQEGGGKTEWGFVFLSLSLSLSLCRPAGFDRYLQV